MMSSFIIIALKCMAVIYTQKRTIITRIPNIRMLQDNRTKRISPTILPDPILAADMYRNGGGRLTDPEPYGLDPIANDLVKVDIC